MVTDSADDDEMEASLEIVESGAKVKKRRSVPRVNTSRKWVCTNFVACLSFSSLVHLLLPHVIGGSCVSWSSLTNV